MMWAYVASIVAAAISAENQRNRSERNKDHKSDSRERKSEPPVKKYSSDYEADFTPPVFSTTYFPEPSSSFDSSTSASSNDYTGGGGSFDGGGASGDY